jgi:CubicO group peptidase (beta-lactamase class C family)
MVSQAALTSLFEPLQQDDAFSGAVLVAQDGAVLFERAYGYASRQLNVPNTLDTRFHIASMTKMFIAMAALILHEQGRLDLHAKPAAYLPELAALDQDITIHHLLSHTSGIQDVYDVPDLRFAMSKLQHEQGTLLSYLVKLPQLFRPSAKWSYSSTGYLLMGYLMERVTGLPYEELMARYVFTPLSMSNTGRDLPQRINPGRAFGHAVADGHLINAPNDELGDFAGPGELYSTVRDLNKWGDAMFDCPLVTPPTLALLLTPYAQVDWQVDPPLQYGYGWFLAPRLRMHGGGTPGFRSLIRQYPEQRVSAVLLRNTEQGNVDSLISALDALILG